MKAIFHLYISRSGSIHYGVSCWPGGDEHFYTGYKPRARGVIAAYLAGLWARGIFPTIHPSIIEEIGRLPE